MSKEKYIIVVDKDFNPHINIYDNKKRNVIQGKLSRMFGVVKKEFDDVSNDYKYDLVHSILLNFFLMTGILQTDKSKFLSHMSDLYDFAVEAENEGRVELVDDDN